MTVEEILEMIDDVLNKSMPVPLAGKKALTDVDKIGNLIEEIRLCLPSEISKAKRLVQDRKLIIKKANEEAELIISKAQEKAKLLINQQEIISQSEKRAGQIISKAQQNHKEMRNSTTVYVNNMLKKMEELLVNNLTEVRKTRSTLKNASRSFFNERKTDELVKPEE